MISLSVMVSVHYVSFFIQKEKIIMGLSVYLIDFNIKNSLKGLYDQLPNSIKKEFSVKPIESIKIFGNCHRTYLRISPLSSKILDFGPTPYCFDIGIYSNLELLTLFLENIDHQQAWIDTGGYNFHMYVPEYLDKFYKNPGWDWTGTTLDDRSTPIYTDSLIFDLNKYPNDNNSIVPIYPKMVSITPGQFHFICDSEDVIGRESKDYLITIEKPFAIAKYPVTFAEYDCFCKATHRPLPHDLGWGRDQHPVIQITWYEANAYCEWLSKRSGKYYRLPSELEWEYVAKIGVSEDKNHQMVFNQESIDYYHPSWTRSVGEYGHNNLDIYDMFSNVWEWTLDYYHDTCANMHLDGSAWQTVEVDNTMYPDNYVEMERIARGGGWKNYTKGEYARQRKAFISLRGYPNVGFRVVEELR